MLPQNTKGGEVLAERITPEQQSPLRVRTNHVSPQRKSHPDSTTERTLHRPRTGGTFSYRPDVDGLRAVAVLSVILFHLGASKYVKGGFVGVDIFFVISGYLISSIILTEIDAGRFTISGFYERRIRRIAPALLAMLSAVSFLTFLKFLPSPLILYCKSMLAALLSCSNFFFATQSGYFDGRPLDKPLLHTWSLAVEEQFYVVFPLLILILKKLIPGRLKTILIALAALSFLSCLYVTHEQPTAAFYMPYTRAWELLIGTILSFRLLPPLPAYLRNILGLLGLTLIGLSVIYLDGSTPFPGIAAALPTLGAASIICAGESGPNWVGGFLSLRPVVFIGLISYSLYLWHWPLIVLQNNLVLPDVSMQMFAGPHRLHLAIDISLCILLGYLSWRFVEQPFRKGNLKNIPKWQLFRAAGFVFAAFALVATLPVLFHGFPSRFSADAIRVGSYLDAPPADVDQEGKCTITTRARSSLTDNPSTSLIKNGCLTKDAERRNVLVLGDSHAAALWHGIADARPDTRVMLVSMWGCPILHVPSLWPSCMKLSQYVFDELAKNPVDELILCDRWSKPLLPALMDTIQWAHNHAIRVEVAGPVPEYDAPLPLLLENAIARKDPSLPERHIDFEFRDLDRVMKHGVADQGKTRYFSFFDALCGASRCIEYSDSANTIPLLRDTNHFTREGSEMIGEKMVSAGIFK